MNKKATHIYNYLGDQVVHMRTGGCFDLTDLPAGVYVIRLGAGKDARSGKIIIWE